MGSNAHRPPRPPSDDEETGRQWAKNPFVMPPDEEVFRMREEEKRKRQETREHAKSISVEDKSTFASRMSTTIAADAMSRVLGSREGRMKAAFNGIRVTAATSTEHRTHEKENMADFIAKKREIFLVQMSLDTKRAEIRKLEERALQREEALRKSEQMLEEDALRFDAFLKENDEKVQDAIKKAETEAKAKQDKATEIKRLNAAIATIRSDLNKYEEQLDDCKKYKDFLDNLTPKEWVHEQACIAAERQRQLREARDARRRARREARAIAKAAASAAAGEDAATVLDVAGVEESESDSDASPVEDEEEESPMYFQNPGQLMELFRQLEEQNLFLIQNCQETEEALEELKNKFRDTRARMEADTSSLLTQIDVLKVAIKVEEDRSKALREKANTHADYSGHETTLEQLAARVTEVYIRCGFDNDASIGTLQMLTNIEGKLEEYLSAVSAMPVEFVEATEKSREKERRHKAREEKLEHQRREQEKRVQRSLERAQAPIHKKTGKTIMFRSQPEHRKKVDVDVGLRKSDEEEELAAFLARDV